MTPRKPKPYESMRAVEQGTRLEKRKSQEWPQTEMDQKKWTTSDQDRPILGHLGPKWRILLLKSGARNEVILAKFTALTVLGRSGPARFPAVPRKLPNFKERKNTPKHQRHSSQERALYDLAPLNRGQKTHKNFFNINLLALPPKTP